MRVDQTRFRPDPTSTSTHGAEAAQPLLRLFRPHRERKAVSVRLLRPHRGRKAVSASVRLLRPHRGRKAVSALSRCAVSHLECHICRSQFGIVKEKYRHCIHTMLHPWTCFVLGGATFGLHPRVHLPCGRWRCSSTRLKRTGSQTRRRCDSRPRPTWTIASPSFRPTAPRSPRCICTAPRGTRRGTRAVEFPWWVAPAITAQPAELGAKMTRAFRRRASRAVMSWPLMVKRGRSRNTRGSESRMNAKISWKNISMSRGKSSISTSAPASTTGSSMKEKRRRQRRMRKICLPATLRILAKNAVVLSEFSRRSGAEAAQPLLRLFRPHRERKAVSAR